jgi:hypothetical protein
LSSEVDDESANRAGDEENGTEADDDELRWRIGTPTSTLVVVVVLIQPGMLSLSRKQTAVATVTKKENAMMTERACVDYSVFSDSE